MADLKCKFELFRNPMWKVSRPIFGSRLTICGSLFSRDLLRQP